MPQTQQKFQEKEVTAKEAKQTKSSSIAFVEVAEIRDNILVLKDGQYRGVLAVSSANFALKSSEEQQIIVNTFQGVLNSLEFPIQILVQSRRLNLDPYIEKLRQLEDQQTNDLLRVKMQEYIEYIKELLHEVNIMKKDFYIIVGYEPATFKTGFFSGLTKALNPTKIIKQKNEDFLRNRKFLMGRVDQLASRFGNLDLKVDLLSTEQLIALMYNSYNPDTLDSVRIRDVGKLDVFG
jgi:vacuolar-type H+-ATPase subunit I/STV1